MALSKAGWKIVSSEKRVLIHGVMNSWKEFPSVTYVSKLKWTMYKCPKWRTGTSNYISKMYFSHWEPPEVPERMWSVNLDGSISGEYQTIGGHSGRPAEQLKSLMTGTEVPWEWLCQVWEHLGALERTLGLPGSASDNCGSTGDKSGSAGNKSGSAGDKSGSAGDKSRCADDNPR
jgi:hypothetical protein